MISNWIFESNLKSFLEIIASLAGYAFDPNDWNAIRLGIGGTNQEQNKQYDYGKHTVAFQFALDPGSCVLFISAETDRNLEDRIALVMRIAQEYRLSK